jgi:hypothetical protein
MAVGLALRVREIGQLEYWYDEMALWLYAVSGTPPTPLEPPLMSWLLASVMRVLHTTSPLVIHLIPAVLMTLTIPLAFLCGRLAGGRESTGWIAAVLVTVSPMSIYYSREGRPYGLFVLLCGALYLAFLAAHRRNSMARWGIYSALLCLGGLTHLLTVQNILVFTIFSVAYALFVDSPHVRVQRFVRFVIFTAIGALAGSSWGIFRFLESEGSAIAMGQAFTGAYTFGVVNFLRTVLVNFGPGPVANVVGRLTSADALAFVFLVFFVLGIWRLRTAGDTQLLLFAAIVFPVPLLINYASLGIASGWDWVRYVSHLLFPFLIVVSLGVQAAASMLPGRWQAVVPALLVAAILPGTWRLQVREDYRQYRDMASYLHRNEANLQGIIVLSVRHDIGQADERIMNIYYQKKEDRLPVYALTAGVFHKVLLLPGRVGQFAAEDTKPENALPSGRYALLWRRPVTDCALMSGWVKNASVASATSVTGDDAPTGVTACELSIRN